MSFVMADTISVTSIEQLDELAVFNFSIMSDNKGYSEKNWNNYGDVEGLYSLRVKEWIKEDSEFVLGLGDHFMPNRDNFLDTMQNDTWWHHNFYPNVGDHDNETKILDYNGQTGGQNEWGRGWVIFKAVDDFFNRPEVEFRQPESSKVE